MFWMSHQIPGGIACLEHHHQSYGKSLTRSPVCDACHFAIYAREHRASVKNTVYISRGGEGRLGRVNAESGYGKLLGPLALTTPSRCRDLEDEVRE